MESLEGTEWDVVIAGTGLQQSLLALALSRSGKKILHVDKNDHYGGAEAALSLQEIDAWVAKVNDASESSAFRNAIVTKPEQERANASLGFSRAYSVSLSPQLMYTRSNLLPSLVSSKVHSQLEFLAVGSWWVFKHGASKAAEAERSAETSNRGELQSIPGAREDVFSDKSLDLRSTRALMKFLKLAVDAEAHRDILEEWGGKPFPEYLSSQYNMPSDLQAPLLALTASLDPPKMTLTSDALPRIQRHLTSIGLFGPGFGLVLPKWGCLSEIAQVGCRAGAVGGGVYILKKGVERVRTAAQRGTDEGDGAENAPASAAPLNIELEGGEEMKARWIAGSTEDLPQSLGSGARGLETVQIAHSVAIISSPLSPLFYLPAEGAPAAAATVVFFPAGSLAIEGSVFAEGLPPVYVSIHSSETGECPVGQCIVYAHTSLAQPHASTLLTLATNTLLSLVPINEYDPKPSILWTLHYTRHHHLSSTSLQESTSDGFPSKTSTIDTHMINFPSLPPGLALDDSVLRTVRNAWAAINGGDDDSFMLFEERSGMGDDVVEEDETLAGIEREKAAR